MKVIRESFKYHEEQKNEILRELWYWWANEEWWQGWWGNDSLITFNYDEYGNNTERIAKVWEDSSWHERERIKYNYDNRNQLLEIKDYRKENATDSAYLKKSIHFKYDNDYVKNGNLVSGYKYIYVYNNQKFVGYYIQSLDISNELWENSLYIEYFYFLPTRVSEQPYITRVNSLNVFPNPVYESTNITYRLKYPSHVIIKVFDVLGNTIAVLVDENKEPGGYNIDFDATSLPPGAYFYQLQTQSETLTRKMIVLE
ncbi:T9SS type A sorting domain-containing protein [Bacteroidota bacterium]